MAAPAAEIIGKLMDELKTVAKTETILGQEIKVGEFTLIPCFPNLPGGRRRRWPGQRQAERRGGRRRWRRGDDHPHCLYRHQGG